MDNTSIATSFAPFVSLKVIVYGPPAEPETGATYLVYLGTMLLLSRRTAPSGVQAPAAGSVSTAFRQGVLTNVTNPKVALFFLAFLPQFIAPASPHKVAAFLVLGAKFVATSTVWCVVLAAAVSRLRLMAAPDSDAAQWLRRLAGACFIVLGIRLAFTEP